MDEPRQTGPLREWITKASSRPLTNVAADANRYAGAASCLIPPEMRHCFTNDSSAMAGRMLCSVRRARRASTPSSSDRSPRCQAPQTETRPTSRAAGCATAGLQRGELPRRLWDMEVHGGEGGGAKMAQKKTPVPFLSRSFAENGPVVQSRHVDAQGIAIEREVLSCFGIGHGQLAR